MVLMMLSEYSEDPVTDFFRDVFCLLAFGNAWVQDTLSVDPGTTKAGEARFGVLVELEPVSRSTWSHQQ
jgi:hypothetical protein